MLIKLNIKSGDREEKRGREREESKKQITVQKCFRSVK